MVLLFVNVFSTKVLFGQPHAQSSSAISDVTSPVKFVGLSSDCEFALASRPPPLTWIGSITGGPSSLCEFKMAVNIKDLYGNSGKRFKSINTR